MRSFLLASLVSLVAARDWQGVPTKWATHPDKTAGWYERYAGGRLPELAPTITTVVENKSSVVKLECVACPFRVRQLHPKPEYWQEPPQDNSLLLNLTVDASIPALLLNGHPIAALAPMPLHISTFQVNANFSKDHMDKAVEQQLMEASWNLGTKFGTFELQYEHTVVGTREPGKSWIQFDVTGIHYYDKTHYELRAESQKMVQILLRETAEPHALFMEEVQVVDRKDRAQPYVMDCGKLAMVQTSFNPLEWDHYGKLGTWSRSLNMMWFRMLHIFWDFLPLVIISIVVIPIVLFVRWVAKRGSQRKMDAAEDDAEAACLVVEHDDAPPEYEDVPSSGLDEEKS